MTTTEARLEAAQAVYQQARAHVERQMSVMAGTEQPEELLRNYENAVRALVKAEQQ